MRKKHFFHLPGDPQCTFLTLCLCLIQVQPKHVKEAFRLLNKSIIRVETPDINLDQEEEEAMEEEEENRVNGKGFPLFCYYRESLLYPQFPHVFYFF